MAKKNYKKLSFWLMSIPTLIVAIALGGTFISGFFTDKMILSYLPLIIHQIVGWIFIGGGILTFIYHLIK